MEESVAKSNQFTMGKNGLYCNLCGDYVNKGCDNSDCKYFNQLKYK